MRGTLETLDAENLGDAGDAAVQIRSTGNRMTAVPEMVVFK